MRRPIAVSVFAGSLGLLAGTLPMVVQAGPAGPVRDVGEFPALGGAGGAVSAIPSATTAAASEAPARASVETRVVRPASLRIPEIGVDASVLPVGVDGSTGLVAVPDNAFEVAWYRYGPSPGQAGSAVLAAHVDFGGRPGAFFSLRELGPGSIVKVGYRDGTTRTFEVVARRSYLKDELPRRLFAREGEPMLTLITCGGAFDPAARSYAENVVVVAVPVSRAVGPGIDDAGLRRLR